MTTTDLLYNKYSYLPHFRQAAQSAAVDPNSGYLYINTHTGYVYVVWYAKVNDTEYALFTHQVKNA